MIDSEMLLGTSMQPDFGLGSRFTSTSKVDGSYLIETWGSQE